MEKLMEELSRALILCRLLLGHEPDYVGNDLSMTDEYLSGAERLHRDRLAILD